MSETRNTRDTYLLLRAFVDELARCGVRDACTSPGSRSTPLVLSLVRDGRLRCSSHVDERCAAFFAVGAARASGDPAVIACTSGTAAANYLPAVIEAHEARVPLIVLTADRPPELREVGAGQTIDQIKLYGSAVKWFFEVGTHAATPERLRWIRQLACRAVHTARDAPAGPVHLNFPLREPLVLDEELSEPGQARPDGAPFVRRTGATRADPDELARRREQLAGFRRPVIVAGRGDEAHSLAAHADRLGIPLLADPLSGLRRGGAAVAHYDALLRDDGFASAHRPDAVLRSGDLPTSKPLRQWLAGLDAPQIAFEPVAAWQDPAAVVGESTRTTLTPVLDGADIPLDGGWLGRWRTADARAAAAIDATLGDELNEPRIARELATALPSDGALLVASSMPVRDVETFWPVLEAPPMLLSNRGANGIDGTISTGYGVSRARGGPTALLIGDVALAHDLGGLLAAKRLDTPLTIVLVDNAGGGIFDFLPVSTQRDAFDLHVATPTGLEAEHVAALFGLAYRPVADVETFRTALRDGLAGAATTLLHARTDRAENVVLHRRVWSAVAEALQE